MQQAETIFNVIRERGRRGLPLKDVYRLLYNPELYLLAYGRLYRNAGAMTRGTTPETVDAMSLGRSRKSMPSPPTCGLSGIDGSRCDA